MKRVLLLAFTVLFACLLSACSRESAQFTVTMQEAYSSEQITLTVTLPSNAKEHEITFTIDGKEYAIASMPTVNDPTFVFEDISDDGMMEIRMEMASDESEKDVLYMLLEDGAAELCFIAPDGDFSRLTDYLGTN